jgi:hypothetical protein
MYQRPLQEQINDVFLMGTTFLGMVIMLGFVKSIVNDLQTSADEKPLYLPQLKRTSRTVTVTCPICHREIEIPDYGKVTRTEALRRHIESSHRVDSTAYQPQVLIDGGDPVPVRFRDLVGFLRDPLPEYLFPYTTLFRS